MNYILNGQAMTTPFVVPASVVDSSLFLASHTQLKVLLVFLKNMSSGTSAEAIAEFLSIPVSEAEDALEFWAQAGILISLGATETVIPEKKESPAVQVKPTVVKPTREEIAQLAFTDEKLAILLREAEMKFARPLRDSELKSLAWLYTDNGMDVSLILMLVEYAINQQSANVRFIEQTALAWLDAGVSTLTEAEDFIAERGRRMTAWGLIESAFGIEKRKPSDKELEYARKWVLEWGFGKDILHEAYNRCIDQKTKLNMGYIGGILENWHKSGVKTLADIENADNAAKEKASKKDGSTGSSDGAYDKSLIEELLNR